jgi:hypothetical protein
MKNALLYKVNMFFAYMTVHVVFGYAFATFLLKLQGKINDYFEYDWSAAVAQYKSR